MKQKENSVYERASERVCVCVCLSASQRVNELGV